MGCFKPKRRQAVKADAPPHGAPGGEQEGGGRPALSDPPSFKSTVKLILNAQRFTNSHPRLRSSHPSYGNRNLVEGETVSSSSSSSSSSSTASSIATTTSTASSSSSSTTSTAAGSVSPALPLGGRARSATELGSSLFDIAAAYSNKAALSNCKPMPLPFPQPIIPSASCGRYRLPRPCFSSDPMNSNPNGDAPPSKSMPLPPPKDSLRFFSYDVLAAACGNFAPDCCIEHDSGNTFSGSIKAPYGKGEGHQDVLVMRLWENWQQGVKEWISGLSGVARFHNMHLCKFVGYYAEDGMLERMIVYEKQAKGSLYNLLFGASDSPPLDWATRMKIALGAAQGLASLHDKSPDQVLYTDFRTSLVQVDAEYSAKLAGYWNVSNTFSPQIEHSISNQLTNPRASAYHAPEVMSQGEVSCKSNVWSFGVVLLELMSGRKNLDERLTMEGKNSLVQWARPFLRDEGRLFLIMDPKLQGRFPSKGCRMMADLALQCLQNEPGKRPEMSKVMEVVKAVHESRYMSRYSSREPASKATVIAPSKHLTLAPSFELRHERGRSLTKFDLIKSPPLRPLIIPPRSCATSYTTEDAGPHYQQEYYLSAPLEQLKGF